MKLYDITLRQYRMKRVYFTNWVGRKPYDLTIAVEGKTIKEVNDRIDNYLRANQDYSDGVNPNKIWYIITSHTKISKSKNSLWENFIKYRLKGRETK